MRPKTTAALALAGAALAAPAAHAAAEPPAPALRAPLAGHLTVEAQMRAERRAERHERLTDRAVRLAGRAKRAEAPATPASPVLEAIAACESGGDPTAIGGGGLYRGKYQFSMSTWASIGGMGDPAAAPEAEQDARAAALYAREGAAPWPVCGR